MTKNSNKATCKLEISLSEFYFMVQGSCIGRLNKRKNVKQAPKLAHKEDLRSQLRVPRIRVVLLLVGQNFK